MPQFCEFSLTHVLPFALSCYVQYPYTEPFCIDSRQYDIQRHHFTQCLRHYHVMRCIGPSLKHHWNTFQSQTNHRTRYSCSYVRTKVSVPYHLAQVTPTYLSSNRLTLDFIHWGPIFRHMTATSHERHRLSNHRQLHCWTLHSCMRASKKSWKIRVTGPLWG